MLLYNGMINAALSGMKSSPKLLLILAAATAFSLVQPVKADRAVQAGPIPGRECSRWRLYNVAAWFRFTRRGCPAAQIESLRPISNNFAADAAGRNDTVERWSFHSHRVAHLVTR